MNNRFRTLLVAVVTTVALLVAPAAASAAPTSDKWIVRSAMQSAWDQQSYSDQLDICVAFLEQPGYWAGRFATTATQGTNVSWSWAKRYMKNFFYSHCSALV